MTASRREFLALSQAVLAAAATSGSATANATQSANAAADGANWGRWGKDDQKRRGQSDGWDTLDARPDSTGHPFPVHRVLYRYGVALLDNALLAPLAEACAEQQRYEFMFMALPLKVTRGTGSPVNPIALF